MTQQKIIIGTRGSKLALYQANLVKEKLLQAIPKIQPEIKIIKTKGDKILDVALSKIGDKGLFTKELEIALINKDIDIAVHSLKDLPTELSEEFTIGAVLERHDYRDALVSLSRKKLNELDPDAKIATSSLRRKAGLLKINPDFNIVDIRGNVQTRLQKMEDDYCDGMIMAAAGLKRLGLDRYISEILDPDLFIPAVSQGIIGIESRKDDKLINDLLQAIHHQKTWTAAVAERAFMRTLQGGCQVPVGCFSKLDQDKISLTGFVASTNGKLYLRESISGEIISSEMLGTNLAKNLIGQGAQEILNQIRPESNS